MVQVVVHLPSKREVLSSNTSTAKKKDRKKSNVGYIEAIKMYDLDLSILSMYIYIHTCKQI
jgi:hypothetical protein